MVTKKLIFLHFIFISFTLTPSSPSSPPLNFTIFGTAIVNGTSIILTQHLKTCISPPPYPNFGRVFYEQPITLHDSSVNSTFSFHTSFSFTITPPPYPCLSGEGIAFLITSDSNSLPPSIGCMGLPKSLIQNSNDSWFLAVEFDTRFHKTLRDINDNHVGIDLDSVFSIASVDLMKNGIDLKNGKQITAWIEYRNLEKVIRIWVGFNGSVYVAFSAANGRGSAVHSIDRLHFNTSESVSSKINNCLVCFPVEDGTGLQGFRQKSKFVLDVVIQWSVYLMIWKNLEPYFNPRARHRYVNRRIGDVDKRDYVIALMMFVRAML
ncbi:hypothetical protein L1887_43225 [Cichorium endivia]|nr:hypothetical protein L1887_43225 [Cichorium endivia]